MLNKKYKVNLKKERKALVFDHQPILERVIKFLATPVLPPTNLPYWSKCLGVVLFPGPCKQGAALILYS